MVWDTCTAQSLRALFLTSQNKDDSPLRFVTSVNSKPQNMNQVLSVLTEMAVFLQSHTLVIKGNDTQRETTSHSQPVLPSTPPPPFLVSSAPSSVTAAATSQWLEFNQPSSKQRSGPKQEWLSREFVNEDHGPISNYESKARQTVLTLL